MRLGAYPCKVAENTKASAAYGEELVYERHRHRYEMNLAYRAQLEEAGFIVSGISPDGRLIEIMEMPDHPYFVACQFHPEFAFRPNRPSPLIRDFIRAALEHKN